MSETSEDIIERIIDTHKTMVAQFEQTAVGILTGIAALMYEGSRKLAPKEVSLILRKHVHQDGDEIGFLDACGALASLYAGLECRCCDIAQPTERHQARAPKL